MAKFFSVSTPKFDKINESGGGREEAGFATAFFNIVRSMLK